MNRRMKINSERLDMSDKDDEKCKNPGQSGKFDGTQKEMDNTMSLFSWLFLEKMENGARSRFGATLNHCALQKMKSNDHHSSIGMPKLGSSSTQTPFKCPSTLPAISDNDLVKRYDKGACSGSDSLHQCKEDLAEESIKITIKEKKNIGPSIVLVDEEAGQQTETVDACNKDIAIFYPSEDDVESVEIRYSYLDCLASERWLTSSIINFYIRYLQQHLYSIREDGESYHFFNTYFYELLRKDAGKKIDMEASFTKIRRWWKGVKLFEKAYIFLPINDNFHWSLVIICMPNKADGDGPTIIHLDSLRLHSSKLIFANIRRFLICEWEFLRKDVDLLDHPFLENTWKEFPQRINVQAIEVPQQSNEYDCGLFVLSFIEQFIKKSPRRMKKEDLTRLNEQWFEPVQASSLREKIMHILKDKFDKEKEEN